MKNLGNRLEAVFELLKSEKVWELFADIGSDHAYLAVEMAVRGAAKKSIAADINSNPLEKGRQYALDKGVNIEFRLSNGFDCIEGLGIDAAAICGMGGELIADIIKRSNTAKKCFLVLQPMTAQENLREFLWFNGFEIESELYVTEHGKPYVIISARFTGRNTAYGYSDLFLGKVRPNTPEFAEYAKKVLNSAKKRRLGEQNKEKIDGLISECQTQIINLSGTNF